MAEVAVFSYKETAFLMLKCAVFSYKNHPCSEKSADQRWSPSASPSSPSSHQFLPVTVVGTVGQIKGEVLPSHSHTSLGMQGLWRLGSEVRSGTLQKVQRSPEIWSNLKSALSWIQKSSAAASLPCVYTPSEFGPSFQKPWESLMLVRLVWIMNLSIFCVNVFI